MTCVLCSGELKDPYLLACLHCLCKECLPKAASEDGHLKCPAPNCGDCSTMWQETDAVTLPRCDKRARGCVPVQCATISRYVESRKIVQKMADGERVDCNNPNCQNADSGAAQAIGFCFDCCHFICISCQKSHKAMEAFMGKHDIKSVDLLKEQNHCKDMLGKPVPLSCSRHKGKVLEYYCEACDLLMCQACTVDKDSTHHPIYLSEEDPVPPQHVEAMEQAVKVAFRSKEEYRLAREAAEKCGSEVEKKKEEALQDVGQSFQDIRAAVDRCEKGFHEKIKAVFEARIKGVTDAVHLYQQKEAILSNKQSMLSFLSTEGSPNEVISYRRVLGAGQMHFCETAVSRVIQFLPKQKAALLEAIEGFGYVELGACPANCTIEPAPENVCKCSGDHVDFTLTTANSKKTPCSVGGENVQALLRPRPPIQGQPVNALVNDEGNGQYKVTLDLPFTGECELSVLVNGAHIWGSPFVVELHPETDAQLLLKRDVSTLGKCKETLQFPQQPGKLTGIAVARDGAIFVTDYDCHKIHVFDAKRKFVKSIGHAHLRQPRAITITTEGLLYVATSNGVKVLKDDGAFVKEIDTGERSSLWDVTVHNGEIFVADTGQDLVTVFSHDGTFVRSIGSEGTDAEQFTDPTGVAVSPDGNLYVSDYKKHRVHVVTPEGRYSRGFGEGEIFGPQKLQFSNDNCVLVANLGTKHNCVTVFDQGGAYIKTFDCVGYPRGMAVDQKGDLLVACWTGQCVRIF